MTPHDPLMVRPSLERGLVAYTANMRRSPVGMGAGIGDIFKTPLGGAMLAAEILTFAPADRLRARGHAVRTRGGRPPFVGDSAAAVTSQHINAARVAPSTHNPTVPPALDALILRVLAKAPGQRPENASAVVEELAALLESAPN